MAYQPHGYGQAPQGYQQQYHPPAQHYGAPQQQYGAPGPYGHPSPQVNLFICIIVNSYCGSVKMNESACYDY